MKTFYQAAVPLHKVNTLSVLFANPVPDVSSLRPLTTIVLKEHLQKLTVEISRAEHVVYVSNQNYYALIYN